MVQPLLLDFPVCEARGREDFFVSSSNELAIRWLDTYPAWPTHGLIIYGDEGSGKSHLAQIFASSTDCVVCDDIETHDAAELFHLYNDTKEQGGHILFTCQRSVEEFVLLPDLLSRLKSCSSVRIDHPDDALLGAVLMKQLADRQFTLEPEALRYAVRNTQRSFAAVKRLAEVTAKLVLAKGRRITVPLIKEALADIAA